MPVIETKLIARSADFVANADAMRALTDDLNQKLKQVQLGGGEAARSKHLARGKLLPRDRVTQLLDPGSPFLEVAPMAASAWPKTRSSPRNQPSRETAHAKKNAAPIPDRKEPQAQKPKQSLP